MAQRSFWKGYLKLSLVTCPVAMTPAITDNEKVSFHILKANTGNRVVSTFVDAVSGKPVEDDDQVKGYPRGEDGFVMLEEEDLASIGLESTRTIAIEMFVPADSIDWIWYDSPHYMVPNGTVGEEAFSVIREAMVSTATVGIARVVLYRRERALMLQPRGKGIVLWTLRYGDEVRDAADYFGDHGKVDIDGGLVDLLTRLIQQRSAPWSPDMVADPVQAKLLDIIAAKKKGRKPTARAMEAPSSGNVINIMDALRKSIDAESKPKKP